MRRWMVSLLCMALLGVLAAPPATAHDRDVCLVEYKPGHFEDFQELQRIDRGRRDGPYVHYIFERTVLNVRYDSPEDADHWIREVRRQLRYC